MKLIKADVPRGCREEIYKVFEGYATTLELINWIPIRQKSDTKIDDMLDKEPSFNCNLSQQWLYWKWKNHLDVA